MADTYFLRAAKLKAPTVLAALRHNKRELQSELGGRSHIDPARTRLNYSLGPAQTALQARNSVKSAMASCGIAKMPRVDSVAAIELLFSLPVGSQINHRAYFADCLAWVQTEYACLIFSAEVHLDESTPHCHVLLLPLKDGRMIGNALMGNCQLLAKRHASFMTAVGVPHGLTIAPKRVQHGNRLLFAKQVVAALTARADPVLQSAVWPLVRDAIYANPMAFAQALGLAIAQPHPAKRLKTMAQIFTSKGAGSERGGPAQNASSVRLVESPAKPIPARVLVDSKVEKVAKSLVTRFDDGVPVENLQTLCSVVFEPESAFDAHDGARHSVMFVEDLHRVSDASLDAAMFDPETGEFRDPPVQAVRSQKSLADRAVHIALKATATGQHRMGLVESVHRKVR